VVVGVNGTPAGHAAVRLGAREAVSLGRELRVVHAFTWPDPKFGQPPQGYAAARRDASKILDRAVTAAQRSTPGVRVRGELIDGPPIRVLRRQSRTAEMLVLGADDELTGHLGLSADSVLLQTVSRAFCPIVVARGTRPSAGPLLAAVDGSDASLQALRLAAAEAERHDAPLDVAHVISRRGSETAGRKLLDAAVAAVPELRNARKRLLIGDPAGALVRASRKSRMVLIGPRGADGAALLGPVAQELLRHGACPTLFVHGTTALRH
jgi:nucleotide-binding universal stress UspA family protein